MSSVHQDAFFAPPLGGRFVVSRILDGDGTMPSSIFSSSCCRRLPVDQLDDEEELVVDAKPEKLQHGELPLTSIFQRLAVLCMLNRASAKNVKTTAGAPPTSLQMAELNLERLTGIDMKAEAAKERDLGFVPFHFGTAFLVANWLVRAAPSACARSGYPSTVHACSLPAARRHRVLSSSSAALSTRPGWRSSSARDARVARRVPGRAPSCLARCS